MTEDELREQLAKYSFAAIQGTFYRATLLGRDPATASYYGGRWMPPDAVAVLYMSFSREGALAEMAFRLGLNTPIPRISINVHRLKVYSPNGLALSKKNLTDLEVDFSKYQDLYYSWTEKIGLAAFQIGATAIQVPSARWSTENLIAIDDTTGSTTLELLDSEVVDWIAWAQEHAPHFLVND
ncbi:MAG: RES family NAD+ phosphorylase [Burkholderiales bacterium]